MIFLQLVWLLLPAGFANMSAVVLAKLLPSLAMPVDLGKTYRGKRVLGDHKTFRGVIGGTVVGGLVFLLQLSIVRFNPSLQSLQWTTDTPWFLGFVMGCGALSGDMIKSFFKRQIGVAPGKSWIPFDQIDWILGSLLFALPLIDIPPLTILSACVVGFVLHIVVKFTGHLLKIDDKAI